MDDKPIRTEFIILLCPDERLNEQIRTFTAETFRFLVKETALRDRQHLRAFKLSSFFYVNSLAAQQLDALLSSVGARSIRAHVAQDLRLSHSSVPQFVQATPSRGSALDERLSDAHPGHGQQESRGEHLRHDQAAVRTDR